MEGMAELPAEEKQEWMEKIDKMTQIQMAYMRRFTSAGHPVFSTENLSLYNYFNKKFKESGGMTPTISKLIGWR